MTLEKKDYCRQAVRNAVYGKVNKNFYRCHCELLRQINFTTIRLAYIFSSLLYACLLAYAFAAESSRRFLSLYAGTAFFLAAMSLLILTALKNRYKYARMLYYLFAAAVFIPAIFGGTVMSPDRPAISFFVLLMILPLLYVEQPIHSVLLSAFACILFCGAAAKADAPEVAGTDIAIAVCCFFVSGVFTTYIRNMYLQYLQATIIFRTQSETDRLTGVFNKECTENLCEAYLLNSRGISDCALFIIDLDNFKYINDTYGHKQGDVFLNETGRLLKESFYEKDVVGRIGGDEFLVLMKDVTDVSALSKKASIIEEKIQGIYSDLTVTRFTCSIGISLSSKDKPLEYHTMFFRADQALYSAKQKGRNRYVFYSGEFSGCKDKPLMLVVDDSEVSRAILCSCFESEYEILPAENGAQALEYMKRYSSILSVVLLDIEMPVINGYDVLIKVRADRRMAQIPILMVTAHGENEMEALKLGAVDLITKPFDPLVVRKRVANARRLFTS